jgi:methylmalonyl-CoA mutase N-terminal domain/subunit
VTLQALAAVLGGTQSLHTNSRDEALALPTQDSVRIALRTQQIVAYESGAAETVDPLAGSYYVESLTNRVETEALAYIRRIDELGGAVKAIEEGYVQREIQDAAYAYQKQVESGDRVVVGLNKFQAAEGKPQGLLKVDPTVGERQAAALRALRARRDGARVEAALRDIDTAARGSVNLMPPILEAVRAYATLGEICDAMRAVFGEHRHSAIF